MVGGVALAGCGGSDGQRTTPSTVSRPPVASTPSPPSSSGARRPDPAATRVIKAWTTALRNGHVDAASRYFAIPSIVQNGTPPIAVRTRAQARAFNASLPCGADFRRAVAVGRFTVVVFRLTNRPGGDCAKGVGQAAGTAFVIRHGKIFEWRRVDDRTVPQGTPGPQPTPSSPQAPTATGPRI
jgi:hypothetical protein